MSNAKSPMLAQLDTIAKGLSETFAPFCEVVVHDLTHPQQAIISIISPAGKSASRRPRWG